ncbi:hypothetical protein G5V58_16555 [Nocardioides anomalus]|uniref:Uncharacterized protein n=1 Tax=Nocardioides anomalus TaxID=2712223 RepID=A0A6G6WFR6_9ACTN|nr:hypothetical protein [Nocardioides anomalus]QIG44168.1 hypothetical protein G5V58_16555 [Nocardioides anomalus]
MTVGDAEKLAGAMGIASWKVRMTLREYATSARRTDVMIAKAAGLAVTSHFEPWSISEVGISDAAMAALWRHGPDGGAYAITSKAEAYLLGGDLAIVDRSKKLRIYQAKVVQRIDRTTNEYVLKSGLTAAHSYLLNTTPFTWDGQQRQKEGYLALYQTGLPPVHGKRVPRRSNWWARTAGSWNSPALGAVYFWDMMAAASGASARMASARGIMAAPVPPLPAPAEVTRLPVAKSWPWEYGISPAASSVTKKLRGARLPNADRRRGGLRLIPLDDSSEPRMDAEARADFVSALLEQFYLDRPTSLTVVFL